MKQFHITKEQYERMPELLTQELSKVTMSWDRDLHKWYPVAIEALLYASAMRLKIRQENFIRLFDVLPTGINMNVVMTLSNNLELRTAMEMNMTSRDWAEFLVLNALVADRWNQLAEPSRQNILKQFESENNRAKIMSANAGMKMIKGEA